MSGSGELEFEEFCTLAARFLVEEDTEAMQQELREAFRLYDKEGNGYITTDVFRDILHELDDKLSPEELDLMIEEIDADGSGTLDFDGKKKKIKKKTHKQMIFPDWWIFLRRISRLSLCFLQNLWKLWPVVTTKNWPSLCPTWATKIKKKKYPEKMKLRLNYLCGE